MPSVTTVSAELGGAGIHSYDREPRAQINKKYWLKCVVLNSSQVQNTSDETGKMTWAKKLAEQTLREIENH